MTSLTLIPDASTYGVAILVTYGLGASSLAAYLHTRWFSHFGVTFQHSYAAVLVATVGWGLLIIDWRSLVGRSALSWLVAIPLGLAIGALGTFLDRLLLRIVGRRTHRTQARHEGRRRPHETPVVRSTLPLARRRTLRLVSRAPVLTEGHFGPWTLVAVAVSEELLYRGLFLQLALALEGWWGPAMVSVSVVAFALAHVWFGWASVLSKSPLGILCTAVVLASGSVLAAVVAHTLFNLAVWRRMRESPRVQIHPTGA